MLRTHRVHGFAATASSMVERILEASDALGQWLSSNRLRLNQDKTQHIWRGSRAQFKKLSKIDSDSLRLRFTNVHFSSSDRESVIFDLFLDSVLSLSVYLIMQQCLSLLFLIGLYVNSVTSANLSICNFASFHEFGPCFDLRQGWLWKYGLHRFFMNKCFYRPKLQAILSAAALLIGNHEVLPHLFFRNSLHWLSIRQRIQFKICSIVRNCLSGSAPHYLKVFCTRISSLASRSSLRYSTRCYQIVLRTGTCMPGSFTTGKTTVPTGTSNLCPLETFFIHPLISSASTWKYPSLPVSEDTDQSFERLCC